MKGFEQSLEQMRGLTQVEKEEVGYPDWSEWANLVGKNVPGGKKSHYETNANEMLALSYKSWLSSLEDKEKIVVKKYTRRLYEDVNGYLGGYNDDWKYVWEEDELKEMIDYLTSGMNKGVLPEDIVVTRTFNDVELEKFNVGDVVNIKQFVSTSVLDREQRFNKSKAYIYVPANVGKGAFVNGFSEFPNEEEYLINRGQQFLIVNKQVGENGNVYHLRLL